MAIRHLCSDGKYREHKFSDLSLNSDEVFSVSNPEPSHSLTEAKWESRWAVAINTTTFNTYTKKHGWLRRLWFWIRGRELVVIRIHKGN